MTEIDAVITWVDGGDPAHREKRLRHAEGGGPHRAALAATRFADSGEVYYCIASLLKYAGFIRKIWLVTDDQVPPFLGAFGRAGLCRKESIEVVDHRTIFAGLPESLPSFSSLSIEAMLWRIPSLSERFVYFNDDLFLNRPASPDDFFLDGRPVLKGKLESLVLRGWKRRVATLLGRRRPSFRVAQELGGKLAGMESACFYVHHHPHPMRRSVQEAYYREQPEVLAAQVRHRFRSLDQYLPVSLANHLEIVRHGTSYGRPQEVVYLKPGRAGALSAMLEAIRDGIQPYGCIQSLDAFEPEERRRLRQALREKLDPHLPADIAFPDEDRGGFGERAAVVSPQARG